MHWNVALHVWKPESTLPITPISGAQEGEESGVLAYRQKLAVTHSPTGGRKVESKDSDFGNKRIGHDFSPLSRFLKGIFQLAQYRS
jgi:hypothetical protein